jgi:hypothetical protein
MLFLTLRSPKFCEKVLVLSRFCVSSDFIDFGEALKKWLLLLLDEFDKEVLVPKEQGRRRN